MSKPKTAEIADDLTAELNRLLNLRATRAYLPTVDRKQLAELRVFVGVRSDKRKFADRGANEETHRVDVAVMRAVDPQDVEALDACLGVVESIKALFADGGELRNKTMAGADWTALDNDPLYQPAHLQGQQQFTSTITFTYVIVR